MTTFSIAANGCPVTEETAPSTLTTNLMVTGLFVTSSRVKSLYVLSAKAKPALISSAVTV